MTAPNREAERAAMRKCCEHCESPGHPNFCRFKNGERDNHGFWCPDCHPDVVPPDGQAMTGRRVVKPMVGLQHALAQAVVTALDEAGTSQADFAAMLGMSTKHVSQMLTGTAPGSLAVWNLMLFTVGVNQVEIEWGPR